MDIFVKDRKETLLETVNISDTATVGEFKRKFHSLCNLVISPLVKKCSIDRMEFTLLDAAGKRIKRLKDNSKPLSFYEIKDKDTLIFKDLGPQLSWRTVFIIEYLGPLIFFPLFYFYPNLFYHKTERSFTQKYIFLNYL